MNIDMSRVKTKQITVTTFNDLLTYCYGNQMELARMLSINRGTVRKFIRAKQNPVIQVIKYAGGKVKLHRDWGHQNEKTKPRLSE